MRFALAGVVLIALAAPARADPDPTTATLLSAGGTLLPIAGFASVIVVPDRAKMPVFYASVAALAITPSAGQLYAGDTFPTGMKIRFGGAAVFGAGLAILFNGEGKTDSIIGGLVLGGVGLVTMGVGAIYDLGNAGSVARDARTEPRMFSIGGSF